MKKVLVVGGAGFIGSNLCRELFNQGYEVVSLDNYFTGSKDNHIDGVRYIEAQSRDINNIDFGMKFDMLFHLGEYSRVEQSFDDIRLVWELNQTGMLEILIFCTNNDTKLIYAGSSTKFGDGGNAAKSSPYAWTKSTNTDLVESYGRWFSLRYAIVYFYNAYGPNEVKNGKYATLIAAFMERMRLGQPLTVVSPGNQLRNFTHVSDIVEGLIIVGEKGEGDDFGIGSPENFSVIEIAKFFGGRVTMISERPGNRLSAELRTEKTRQLGWVPKWSVKSYIRDLEKKGWK